MTGGGLLLLEELLALPRETDWLEFKTNQAQPERLGQVISALANSAKLHGQDRAFLVWGVDDATHQVRGTTFHPQSTKVGNEPFEAWISRLLDPRIHLLFHCLEWEGQPVVLLEIPAASHTPVAFKTARWLRVGSTLKPLHEFPEKERVLWALLDALPFEQRPSGIGLPADQVLHLLNYAAYFDMVKAPAPLDPGLILARLQDEGYIRPQSPGLWEILSLGALLFAKDLGQFEDLSRKSLRIITYEGKGRERAIREIAIRAGYAAGFEESLRSIALQLPANEEIGRAFRVEAQAYPEVAIREFLVNALIHQDLQIKGAGPTVEIFQDRLEITNPGLPMVDVLRFLDAPPRSRNETLAAHMRRLNLCEERGSGVDRAIGAIELYQLPPPAFEVVEGHTRVTLFSPRTHAEMDRQDRVRACYQHACLHWLSGRQAMTNGSLRQRMGIEEQNYSAASRVIRDTLDARLIRPYGENTSGKGAKYVPFWA
jgi:predicted HTH transcriptional regulator